MRTISRPQNWIPNRVRTSQQDRVLRQKRREQMQTRQTGRLGRKDRIIVRVLRMRLHYGQPIRLVLRQGKMRVKGQALPLMVFPRMRACRVGMQVKIRSLQEARKQGNNRGGCVETPHCGLFY